MYVYTSGIALTPDDLPALLGHSHKKWDFTYIFSMATQFLLKLDVKMRYKYDNIKIPSH